MNEVPLIQNVQKNDINTSIIAIKKQLKQLIEAVGLIESPNAPDLSPYVKKTDITDVVEVGNTNPVTSNGVAIAIEESIAENIVDVVEDDNLEAVTSNAVAESLSYSTTEQKTGGVWIDEKPIYKKSYYLQNVSAGNTTIDNLSSANVDNVINIEQIYRDAGGGVIQGSYFATGSDHMRVLISQQNWDVYCNISTGMSRVVITIFYTKTTD